jgi:hypothetical protein
MQEEFDKERVASFKNKIDQVKQYLQDSKIVVNQAALTTKRK